MSFKHHIHLALLTWFLAACNESGFAGSGAAASKKDNKPESTSKQQAHSETPKDKTTNSESKSGAKSGTSDDQATGTDAATEDGKDGGEEVGEGEGGSVIEEEPLEVTTTINEIKAALDNLRWNLPCEGGGGGSVCSCAAKVHDQKQLNGDNSRIYKVRARFRGVVEEKTYKGGVANGYFYTGGTPAGDLWNVYSLTISDPPQTYYLNAGTSSQFRSYTIDYEQDVLMRGGATITIDADPQDGKEIRNRDGNGNSLEVADVEAAYNGQFIQVNIIDVKPE